MEELIRTLHEGNYSCVIRKGTETKVFTQKGVADLFELCENKEKFLKNAVVADKVVGKGAASLMVKGGVKSCLCGHNQFSSAGTAKGTFGSDLLPKRNGIHYQPKQKWNVSC